MTYPGANTTFDRDMRALTRRRERESRRDLGRAMGPGFAALERRLRQQAKRLGGIGDAWRDICPLAVVDRTKVLALSRGVLSIGVVNEADRFTLDRFLRSGGERELARRSPTTLRRVKLVRVSTRELVGER
jgi:hypothetical protein